jgi:hypothetical protein
VEEAYLGWVFANVLVELIMAYQKVIIIPTLAAPYFNFTARVLRRSSFSGFGCVSDCLERLLS